SHPPASPFLFPPSRVHPLLPSFPTRRSSDLPRRSTDASSPTGNIDAPACGTTAARRCSLRAAAAFSTPLRRASASHRFLTEGRRSEEHTSELQSRVDLVCRLLLEKKNKQNQN